MHAVHSLAHAIESLGFPLKIHRVRHEKTDTSLCMWCILRSSEFINAREVAPAAAWQDMYKGARPDSRDGGHDDGDCGARFLR